MRALKFSSKLMLPTYCARIQWFGSLWIVCVWTRDEYSRQKKPCL